MDLSSKFKSDVIWNILGYAGILVIGVLLNILILKFYDDEALGVFNQVYAIYIFLSQLAVGGVHLSIQHFVPRFYNRASYVSDFILTALVISLLSSIVVIGLGYLCIPLFSDLLNSEYVEISLYFTLWGLLFFSFNKIILSAHNGLRNMGLFAFFQFIRFALMLFVLLYFIVQHYDMVYLSSILALSECILFFILLVSISKYLRFQFNTRFMKIMKMQFLFGNKAMLGNVLLDLNTKIDIFVLGIYLSDARVGLYSMAATIFEGFSQIAVLLRNNFNPIITKAFAKNNKVLLEKVIHKNVKVFSKFIFVLGLISIVFFPIVPYVFGFQNILTMFGLYTILTLGFIATGGYQVLLMVFNQLGNPSLQTFTILIICLSNVFFNFLFIPFLNVYGAALGTALAFLVQMITIKLLLKKRYKVKA